MIIRPNREDNSHTSVSHQKNVFACLLCHIAGRILQKLVVVSYYYRGTCHEGCYDVESKTLLINAAVLLLVFCYFVRQISLGCARSEASIRLLFYYFPICTRTSMYYPNSHIRSPLARIPQTMNELCAQSTVLSSAKVKRCRMSGRVKIQTNQVRKPIEPAPRNNKRKLITGVVLSIPPSTRYSDCLFQRVVFSMSFRPISPLISILQKFTLLFGEVVEVVTKNTQYFEHLYNFLCLTMDDENTDREMSQFAEIQQQKVRFCALSLSWRYCIVHHKLMNCRLRSTMTCCFYVSVATRILPYHDDVSYLQVMLQEGILRLTSTCFDKCISKPSTSMDSWTEGCLQNCVGRLVTE